MKRLHTLGSSEVKFTKLYNHHTISSFTNIVRIIRTLMVDIAEKIDPEFAGFGVRPIGRINKRGPHRNKVNKHAVDHKRDTFEYLGDEVK